MTTPRDGAASGDRAGSPLTPDDVSAASGGMALVVVAPLPASTKAPTPSQILVFTFIANPDDERSGRPAPSQHIPATQSSKAAGHAPDTYGRGLNPSSHVLVSHHSSQKRPLPGPQVAGRTGLAGGPRLRVRSAGRIMRAGEEK